MVNETLEMIKAEPFFGNISEVVFEARYGELSFYVLRSRYHDEDFDSALCCVEIDKKIVASRIEIERAQVFIDLFDYVKEAKSISELNQLVKESGLR